MTVRARYDGHADWYDEWNKANIERYAPQVRELLGPGDGMCLDLGCGSGHYFDIIAATGRTVVGLDYSADQLRVARSRSHRVVRGDAAALPFADCTFPTVATMWISTDVDDFGAVVAEAAGPDTRRTAGLLRCPPVLQRAACSVDGRWRGPSARHLPVRRMA